MHTAIPSQKFGTIYPGIFTDTQTAVGSKVRVKHCRKWGWLAVCRGRQKLLQVSGEARKMREIQSSAAQPSRAGRAQRCTQAGPSLGRPGTAKPILCSVLLHEFPLKHPECSPWGRAHYLKVQPEQPNNTFVRLPWPRVKSKQQREG